jgi:transcriptional regulator with XRE-family HTH domain
MIRDTRLKKGYTQKQICKGLCSTSSLSRIEHNNQVPGRKLFDAILQRLGVNESIYDSYCSRKEMEYFLWVKKFLFKLERQDVFEFEELMKGMTLDFSDSHNLKKQFFLFVKAIVHFLNGEEPAEVLSLMLHALELTISDFTLSYLWEDCRLSYNEISILNMIAVLYLEMNRPIDGIQILCKLREYIEFHIVDEEEKAKKYPIILHNMAKEMGRQERHSDAYELSEVGLEYCIKSNKLSILPNLLQNKMAAATGLGYYEEAKTLFHQRLTLLQIMKKEEDIRKLMAELVPQYSNFLFV